MSVARLETCNSLGGQMRCHQSNTIKTSFAELPSRAFRLHIDLKSRLLIS